MNFNKRQLIGVAFFVSRKTPINRNKYFINILPICLVSLFADVCNIKTEEIICAQVIPD